MVPIIVTMVAADVKSGCASPAASRIFLETIVFRSLCILTRCTSICALLNSFRRLEVDGIDVGTAGR